MQQNIHTSGTERVAIPDALEVALATNPAAAGGFCRHAASHRREYANWVAAAKRPEPRVRRAGKALAMILAR
jgi:uncharacterized protein YdeI (YjbR/CyaY-like superfamily)